jgi:hypothetical protein
MDEERRLNTTDLILGTVLFILIPLLTLLVLKNSREGGTPTTGPADPATRMAVTAEELEEGREHFAQIYRDNVQLFLIRSQSESDADSRACEVSWARSALDRCRQGFARLLSEARAAPASLNYRARISELEEWIRKVDDDLKTLPAS